jgi:hypothetical protein
MTTADNYLDGYLPRRDTGIPSIGSYPEHRDDFPLRPKLRKSAERILYNPKPCPEVHNSSPWLSEYVIAELLPPEDSFAYLSRRSANVLKISREPSNPEFPLKPDIMYDFLTELLKNENRAVLKTRWGADYARIMEEFRYLAYRVKCRRRIMALYYDASGNPK